MNGTLGATTPSTVAATTLTTSSTVTHNGGTANGVGYLDGSKVLTTGSALVFDGTNLGVGASPAQTLHVKTSTSTTPITLGVLSNATGLPALSFNGAYASTTMAGIYGNGATASNLYYTVPASQNHYFGNADSTKMTLDASGNLGIGITSPGQKLHVENSFNGSTWTKISNGNSGSGAAAGVLLGTDQGDAGALSQNSSNAGYGTAANALRLRNLLSAPLTFETGGTERARIDSSGNLLVKKTAADSSTVGGLITASGEGVFVTSGTEPLTLNRNTSDGTLVSLRQDNTQEGTISVSGTTVSYNGGHLSRWAQTTAPKDESIVKGTVLSNLDEMNIYTDADGNPVDNEQLNKVKVSDVEGDANVAGVFVNWTYDEQHSVDEINMAMTGDMIIRIAQGTTVARGDLLMSAGDGTAKPQGDDIVRSKTVAKVTSTHVTCTYPDGSFCVPCVLMAC
jgi:hypothetical protein